MKKTGFTFVITALLLSLAACGTVPPAGTNAPAAEPQSAAAIETPDARGGQTAQAPTDRPESPEPTTEACRQDGERFETVIMLEGMEETVRYEHIVNESAGFEMDYDYESFVRQSEASRELFLSVWDDPADPVNYLEVRYDTGSAELVSDAVSADLSRKFDRVRETREVDRAGICICIEASARKGAGNMADALQTVYIIPASVGCRVATAHFAVEAAEGFGRRFDYMLHTLSVIEKEGPRELTDEEPLSA